MNRRALLVAGLLASMALGPAQAASEVKVVYVGGGDCQPCLNWKNQYKAAWLASPDFEKVTWIEVDPPRLKEAYQERHWSGDLKPILDQLPRKNGTPRFLIVRDGKIVSNQFGTNKWTQTMSDLHKVLR